MAALHPIFENILTTWQSAPRESQLPTQPVQVCTAPVETKAKIAGTPFAMAKGMKKHPINLRCRVVEYHGNNRATFACPEGHQFRRRVLKRAPNGREPDEGACRMMAHWWKQAVNMPCPKCEAAR